MALPSSGAISLNQMHIEAGGSSGTTVSINDADIRTMINKASGAQASFSEYHGASSSLFTINCNLTLSRVNRGTTTSDYKGNTTFTLTGYGYVLAVNDWNSLVNNSGTVSAKSYLGSFSSTDTSIASSDNNPLGSTGGSTYNMLELIHSTETDTSNNVSSRGTLFRMYLLNVNNSHYGHFPPYNANSALPTGWTNINLTFSYGGTNYNWNWARSNSSFGNQDFTFGQPTSAAYMNIYTNDSGTTNFIGAGNSTNITITGATFTFT